MESHIGFGEGDQVEAEEETLEAQSASVEAGVHADINGHKRVAAAEEKAAAEKAAEREVAPEKAAATLLC
eukprot:2728174-Prymnesium_polylepis.1